MRFFFALPFILISTLANAAPNSFTSLKLEDARTFHCERTFKYDGKELPCDSNVEKNADQLRPYLLDNPEALAALNTYQSNQRSIRTASYFITAGLGLAVLGFVLASIHTQNDGRPNLQGVALRNATLIPGAALAAGSALYTVSILSTNDSNLKRAIDFHNQKHPNQPIELQFKTGFTF